ncbi:MAG: L-dopachrome tautomerase-related protein [Planctomycetota bacterium]
MGPGPFASRTRPAGGASLILLALAASGCVFGPDPAKRNPELVGVAPLLSASALEVVVELPSPPGNLAVGSNGRVYFSFHPEAPPQPAKVCELLADGSYRPFPDAGWQHEREGQPCFVTPLALRADRQGRLWVLDHGDYGDERPSLTAFDLETRAVVHRFEFPKSAARWGSMLNDFAVDEERGWVYIADTGPYTFDPALIVYDITKQVARRVLEDEECVQPADHHLVVQGRFMKAFGLPLQLGVDTIGLTADGETLFFAPLSGAKVYAVPTAALRDPALDEDALLAQVEVRGPKPATDGGIVDAHADFYLTAVEHDALAVLRSDGRLEKLVESKELLAWPDGLALSPDGQTLYASVSQLHHVIGQDPDELPRWRPYRIVSVRLPPHQEPQDRQVR